MEVFSVSGKRMRKVVVATNIAETSITVPGVRFVVDCGFVKVITMLFVVAFILCVENLLESFSNSSWAGKIDQMVQSTIWNGIFDCSANIARLVCHLEKILFVFLQIQKKTCFNPTKTKKNSKCQSTLRSSW
jgi:hypothetical protein